MHSQVEPGGPGTNPAVSFGLICEDPGPARKCEPWSKRFLPWASVFSSGNLGVGLGVPKRLLSGS